ncbi:acyl-CoA thioesterase [Govanella unica]|uniref:Acyl-CoA thioesterase n=1 Tax=Govanella unica TaxID=2975056 RepID=A0A9X3Z6U4_9PROT|nr:acyl-CoA thioesterase [Govania unica]MDA5193472.1 acyl-CoA thioesterase [Govania unica]
MTSSFPGTGPQLTIRTIPKPSDINYNGHIFGGWILSQMDIAGGLAAHQRAGGSVATVAIEGMKFHHPVLVNDLFSVYTNIVKTGRTSLTVHVEVKVMRSGLVDEILVTEGMFVFVRIDENARPVPIASAPAP